MKILFITIRVDFWVGNSVLGLAWEIHGSKLSINLVNSIQLVGNSLFKISVQKRKRGYILDTGNWHYLQLY